MKIGKHEKFIASFQDKKEYVMLIRNLKQSWNNWLVNNVTITSYNLLQRVTTTYGLQHRNLRNNYHQFK